MEVYGVWNHRHWGCLMGIWASHSSLTGRARWNLVNCRFGTCCNFRRCIELLQSLPFLPVVTQNHVLVGGLEHFLFFHMLGIIIPTDELIFFKGVGQPPTSQFYVAATMAYRIRNHPMNRPWGSYRISTHELRVYHFFLNLKPGDSNIKLGSPHYKVIRPPQWCLLG